MPKKIAIIIGSKNDLKQMTEGLAYLLQFANNGDAQVTVHVKSVHRHTLLLHQLLGALSAKGDVDVIIAGAGKAAHLPGCIDAYLRNTLRDTKIKVIGVGFDGVDEDDNLASKLSITQVPGTQVFYAGQGSVGFFEACMVALTNFEEIKLGKIPPDLDLTLAEAYEIAQLQAEGG